jgi:hypothetical protein
MTIEKELTILEHILRNRENQVIKQFDVRDVMYFKAAYADTKQAYWKLKVQSSAVYKGKRYSGNDAVIEILTWLLNVKNMSFTKDDVYCYGFAEDRKANITICLKYLVHPLDIGLNQPYSFTEL